MPASAKRADLLTHTYSNVGILQKVRLWTQKESLEQLIAHYHQLDEDLRAELPLIGHDPVAKGITPSSKQIVCFLLLELKFILPTL